MTISPRGMSILEIYRLYRDNKLIVNRRYQRKLVWTLEEKRAFIESILKEYPTPLILLAEYPKGSYEIIDGMQRLNAIFSFIENNYSIRDNDKDVYFDVQLLPTARLLAEEKVFTPIMGEDINNLDKEKCASFTEYQLPITIYSATNENQINEIFRRINSFGKHLSPQEVRQAGALSQFSSVVRELSAEFRGDVSRDILPLTEMPQISIDSRNMNFGYGIMADDTFWVKQGILRTTMLRDSEDEQLVADIVLSIILKEPFPASKEQFDYCYGKGEANRSNEVEDALLIYGVDNLKNDVKTVFDAIKSMSENYLNGRQLKTILNPTAGSNPVKEPYYTFFMATYELLINQRKEPFDVKGIFESIDDLASKTQRGKHHIKKEDRINNIRICKGLIQDHYKASTKIARSPGTLALDFENYLRCSKVEAPHFEFKQGLYSLDVSKRVLNENMFETIFKNITALANIGKDKEGYLFIGVADKEEDTRKIELLDKLPSIPRISNFGVVGLEREAKLHGVTLDKYINFITEKIRNSELSPQLKTSVNTNVIPITYKGFTVLMIKVKSLNKPSWYKNKLYIRDGSNCKELKGEDIDTIYNLFK